MANARNIAQERQLFREIVDKLNLRFPVTKGSSVDQYFFALFSPKYREWTLYCYGGMFSDKQMRNWVNVYLKQTRVICRYIPLHPVTIMILRERKTANFIQ